MITINEPIITATTQNIKIDEIHLIALGTGSPKLLVSFLVTNEAGERVDTKVLEYQGAEYNLFWDGFNSGKYVYEQLVEKQSLNAAIPDSVEQDFVAVVPETSDLAQSEVVSDSRDSQEGLAEG